MASQDTDHRPDPHGRERRLGGSSLTPAGPATYADAGGAAGPSDQTSSNDDDGRSHALLFLRYGLPALIVIAGIVVMSFGKDVDLEGGGAIVGAGLATYFLNWLFRLGVAGDRERDREDAAREYFDRHGRWPS